MKKIKAVLYEKRRFDSLLSPAMDQEFSLHGFRPSCVNIVRINVRCTWIRVLGQIKICLI